MASNIVNKKIEEISGRISQNFGASEYLVKSKVKQKVEEIFNNSTVKTNNQQINELVSLGDENLNEGDLISLKIELKKSRIEIDRWIGGNNEEVSLYRKDSFKNSFIEETKKINPDITPEKLENVGKYADLVNEVYFDKNGIQDQQNLALENNKDLFGPGNLENSWTHLEGITSLIKKTPGQIKDFKDKLDIVKNEVKDINLPTNLRQARSAENLFSGLNNSNIFKSFSRINELTGGWFNDMMMKAGQNVVSKIGNQAVQEFASNALNVIAQQGFEQGLSTIFNGIASGGVQAVATSTVTGTVTGVAATGVGTAAVGTAGTAAATASGAAATGAAVVGGTAVSATGVGAIVVAAVAVLGAVKKAADKIAEKLGISIKKSLEENFGKVSGGIINAMGSIVAIPTILLGALSAAILIPIAGIVIIYMIGSQSNATNMASMIVPPKGAANAESMVVDVGDTGVGDTGVGDIGVGVGEGSNFVINLAGIKKSINYTYNPDGSLNLDFIDPLPPIKTFKRSDLIKTAEAIIGVPYYWAGGHNGFDQGVLGINRYWGKRISPDKDGRVFYGLDCSGFVAWVYYQTTGVSLWANADSIYYDYSNHISANQLSPGDIAITADGSHIGIYLGLSDGQRYYIHARGKKSGVGPQKLGAIWVSTYNSFVLFGKIKGVNLINDL